MTAVLPGFLQRCILTGTYFEKRRIHYNAMPTESGKELRSKLYGSPYTDCGYETIADKFEADAWDDFYSRVCSEGTEQFYAEHPRKGTTEVFWWNGSPDITHNSVVSLTNDGVREVRDLYAIRLNWMIE